VLRPRGFDRASDNDGILAPEHRIAHRISARNARHELQRQLPPGVSAKVFVQTIRAKGYCLRADVRIRGRGEAGLEFHEPQKLALLYQQEGGRET
jgi:DNA-binding winged helix-turn-helix (wHTH) protein